MRVVLCGCPLLTSLHGGGTGDHPWSVCQQKCGDVFQFAQGWGLSHLTGRGPCKGIREGAHEEKKMFNYFTGGDKPHSVAVVL